MRIVAVPLTPKAFAPYGDVLTPAGRLRPRVFRRGPADEPVHRPAEPVPLTRATVDEPAARGQGAGATRVLVAELPAARRLALARRRRAVGRRRRARCGARRGVSRRARPRRHLSRGHVAPPADDPGSPGALRGGHVARRHEHGRRISHARRAGPDRHRGPDMAPNPPHAPSAPAKPWRSSTTLTSRGGKIWREATTAISSGMERIRRTPSGRMAPGWP